MLIVKLKKNQSEKATCCMIQTIWYPGKDKTMYTVKTSVITEGYG